VQTRAGQQAPVLGCAQPSSPHQNAPHRVFAAGDVHPAVARLREMLNKFPIVFAGRFETAGSGVRAARHTMLCPSHRARPAVDASTLLPPTWLIRVAVAAVWLYEGLWCKLLHGQPHELEVVRRVPYFGPRIGALFLQALGVVEVALAIWVLSAITPVWCALAQTALLVALNASGLLWARRIIHDPGGMVVKNVAFLILGWVAAGLPPWS